MESFGSGPGPHLLSPWEGRIPEGKAWLVPSSLCRFIGRSSTCKGGANSQELPRGQKRMPVLREQGQGGPGLLGRTGLQSNRRLWHLSQATTLCAPKLEMREAAALAFPFQCHFLVPLSFTKCPRSTHSNGSRKVSDQWMTGCFLGHPCFSGGLLCEL